MFLSITSSFWSFIVPRCSLILLLPNVVSSEGLFRYGTSIYLWFPNMSSSWWQLPHKNFLYYFIVGMSSFFINLILKTLNYFHMKVLDERISKWVHFSFCNTRFSRYLHLKFENEVTFLGIFSTYEIPESGTKSLIYEFSKLHFK